MQALLEMIEQFLMDPMPECPWRDLTALLGPLHGQLRRSVVAGLGAADQRALSFCRQQIRSPAFLLQLLALPGSQSAEDDQVDSERLQRNLRGLLAAAQVAAGLAHQDEASS